MVTNGYNKECGVLHPLRFVLRCRDSISTISEGS